MKNTFLGLLTMLSLSLGGVVYHLHHQLKSPEVRQFVILVAEDKIGFGEATPGLSIEKTLEQLKSTLNENGAPQKQSFNPRQGAE